jgi:predicted dienelactone hydrolase
VLAPVLVVALGRWRIRPAWVRLLPWVAVAATVVHLVIERYRWQMLSAYALAVASCVWASCKYRRFASSDRRWVRIAHRVAGAWAIATFAAAIIDGNGIPVFQYPEPSGKYPVGTARIYLVDRSRADALAPAAGSPRELLAVVWYPAEVGERGTAEPFWPDARHSGPALAKILPIPPLDYLGHLRLVASHSHNGVPLSRAEARYPVLVFSHGFAATPWMNTVQMEELASHGFVVFSIGHTYESLVIPFPEGRSAEINEERASMLRRRDRAEWRRVAQSSLAVWTADTKFVVDQIAASHVGAPFAGRLDLERLGVFGMSFGGATAGQFCVEDPRCKAGLNMDGFQWDTGSNRRLAVPFLYFVREGSTENDAIYATSQSDVFKVNFKNATHFNFTDLNLVLPVWRYTGQLGPIHPRRMEEILNAYTVAFFERYLRGKRSPLLEGSEGAKFEEVTVTAHPGRR